jgi:cephalosporin hydroxylase
MKTDLIEDEGKDFQEEVRARVEANAGNSDLVKAAEEFNEISNRLKYSYNFSWQDLPIIQYPQDMVALQEVIWRVKPDLIIETGIARGGSLIFSASLLALIELADVTARGDLLDPASPRRRVLGVDIDIRDHNRTAIEHHSLASRIEMIEGSSIDSLVVAEVRRRVSAFKRVLVLLDSNHTHDHVFSELNFYSEFVSVDSYCVVFDTVIEELPDDLYPDRPWGVGNNPKTAVQEFLASHPEFEVDPFFSKKTLITVANAGWLRRIK